MTPATNRLVDDPMSVVIPPKIQMKLRDIISRGAVIPALVAIVANIGMVMRTTGVLFKNALVIMASIRINPTARRGDLFARLLNFSVIPSSAPDWNNPCPMTRSAITEISAGFPKPASNSVGVSKIFASGSPNNCHKCGS